MSQWINKVAPSYCIMDCEGIQYEWRVFRVVRLNWESHVEDQSDIWAHLISGNIVYDSDNVSCIAGSSALILISDQLTLYGVF
jgi:hypothetical protein